MDRHRLELLFFQQNFLKLKEVRRIKLVQVYCCANIKEHFKTLFTFFVILIKVEKLMHTWKAVWKRSYEIKRSKHRGISLK